MKEFIKYEEIRNRISELARAIERDYEGKEILILGILKGSFHFVSLLALELNLPTEIEFLKTSSYGESKISSGNVKIEMNSDIQLSKKNVLIVEDIVDTGLTLNKIFGEILFKNPVSLNVCSLLIKKDKHKFLHEIKYYGFEIKDEFVVGFGLDYNEKYRNEKNLYILD
jgi:hypoxanthine phosphoribosyltransferase